MPRAPFYTGDWTTCVLMAPPPFLLSPPRPRLSVLAALLFALLAVAICMAL